MSMETMEGAAAQVVANLREAIRLVEAQPASQLQLNVFRSDSVCGTVACTAGLCAMSAYFRERGMRAHGRGWTVIYGAPYMLESTPLGPVKLDEFATLNHFFGTYPGDARGQRYDAYSVLFAPRGRGRWDDELFQLFRATCSTGPDGEMILPDGPLTGSGLPEPTDKQLALMRLNRALMLHIASSAKASAPLRVHTASSALARIAQRVGLVRPDRREPA
jgi:hypothetical protein